MVDDNTKNDQGQEQADAAGGHGEGGTQADGGTASIQNAGGSGYLVATGLNGALKCKVGDQEYDNFSAAEGAVEGDSCTVGEI